MATAAAAAAPPPPPPSPNSKKRKQSPAEISARTKARNAHVAAEGSKFFDFAKKHLFLSTLSDGVTLYRGHEVRPTTVYGPGPQWYSLDVEHSREYALEGSDTAVVFEYDTLKDLVLLDLRYSQYDSEKSSIFLREDSYDAGIMELVAQEAGFDGADKDMEFAVWLCKRTAACKFPIDGYVSLDFGMFAEIVLFKPKECVEYAEEYKPDLCPLVPFNMRRQYALESIAGEALEPASLESEADLFAEAHNESSGAVRVTPEDHVKLRAHLETWADRQK